MGFLHLNPQAVQIQRFQTPAEQASPFPVVCFVSLTFFASVFLKLAAGCAAVSCPLRLGHTDSIATQAASGNAVVNPPGRPLALSPSLQRWHAASNAPLLFQSLSSVSCTALAGTRNPVGADPRAGTGPFPKPRALVLPMVKFVQSKPDGLGHIDTADSDLMHHQYRLSVLQWNPGPARRNPTNIIAAACGRFHAVILQEASDHVPHISDQFIAHTGNTDLAILLNKDTFEPDPMVLAFRENSTSKGTWGMVLLIVRALLRRPSLSGTSTVTFCSVHIHNVVAKKRDASTELLQRLHGYMKQHNVDFIGGDFNMSALFTVGDVFSDPEFSAPGNSFLWGLGALEEQYRECTGFLLILPKRPYEWRVDSHGNAALGFGPRDQCAHLPVFLHLRTTNLPGPDSIMRSGHAQQRRLERRHHKHDRKDVHDRDPVGQGHVSAFLFTPSVCARESFAGQLCFTHCIDAWTFCFKSLSLCLCFCVSVRKSQLTVGSARAPRAQVCVFQTQNQKPQASQHL